MRKQLCEAVLLASRRKGLLRELLLPCKRAINSTASQQAPPESYQLLTDDSGVGKRESSVISTRDLAAWK